MTEQKLQKLTYDKQTGWLTERRQLSPRKQCRMTATQLRLPLYMIFSMLVCRLILIAFFHLLSSDASKQVMA
jgi:hypothetical protein